MLPNIRDADEGLRANCICNVLIPNAPIMLNVADSQLAARHINIRVLFLTRRFKAERYNCFRG